MPFKPVNELPPNPAVRIFFSGLMIIQPNDASTNCEVFVNRSAVDHHFSIEIRERRLGRPDVVLMRHFGPLSFLVSALSDPKFGLNLNVMVKGDPDPVPQPKGLFKYTGPELAGGEDSLDLALDLNSPIFNANTAIEVDTKAGRPSIFMDDAVFYTAEKVLKDLGVLLKKGAETTPAMFATVIGANVYLNDQEFLQVEWLLMGQRQVLDLPKPDDGSTYEIYILNDPLFVNPDEPVDHNKLGEYYKVMLPLIPTAQQAKFEIPKNANKTERGTPRTLCLCAICKG